MATPPPHNASASSMLRELHQLLQCFVNCLQSRTSDQFRWRLIYMFVMWLFRLFPDEGAKSVHSQVVLPYKGCPHCCNIPKFNFSAEIPGRILDCWSIGVSSGIFAYILSFRTSRKGCGFQECGLVVTYLLIYIYIDRYHIYIYIYTRIFSGIPVSHPNAGH